MGRGRRKRGKSPEMCKNGCGKPVLARGQCASCYNRERYRSIRRGDWKPSKKVVPPILDECEALAVAAIMEFRRKNRYWSDGQHLLPLVPRNKRPYLARGLMRLTEKGIIRHALVPARSIAKLSRSTLSSYDEKTVKEAVVVATPSVEPKTKQQVEEKKEASPEKVGGQEEVGGGMVRRRGRSKRRLSSVSSGNATGGVGLRCQVGSSGEEVAVLEEGALEDGLSVVTLDDLQRSGED